jgi:uncharacterized protein YjbI with pentapeptide repeats
MRKSSAWTARLVGTLRGAGVAAVFLGAGLFGAVFFGAAFFGAVLFGAALFAEAFLGAASFFFGAGFFAFLIIQRSLASV